MGLKIMRGKDGAPRGTWYGRFSRAGQKVNINLGVPIRGKVPVDADGNFDVNGTGDAAFAKSRAAALAALADLKAAAKTTGKTQAVRDAETADLLKRYYRLRTGTAIKAVALADLPEHWRAIKRSYTPTKGWQAAIDTWFARYAAFAERYAAEHGTKCETINDVTPEMAAAWFDEIKGAFAWETVTKQWSLMRGAFSRFATSGEPNPFAGVVVRNREIENARVNRVPLTMEQTERLFECARDDAELYPLIVCAACTGMRIGDVCNLKWADVDLRGGFIDCVTAKAGKRVTVPILERLRGVLTDRAAIPGDGTKPSAYVFPAAAARYQANPGGLYTAVKPLFARAVFGEGEPGATDVGADGNTVRPLADAIDEAGFAPAKRTRLLTVYARIKAGERSVDIAAALNCARSQISLDLREIERLTGERLRPRSSAAPHSTRRELAAQTRKRRGVGKRSASLYGWHSLRATFVVLAVEAGVPIETVRKVVGHSTVATTQEYFNPTAKHAAEQMREKMNAALGGGKRRKAIGAPVDVPADGNALAPANGTGAAVRALALARAVLPPDQAAKVAAVVQAAGVDADGEPERALALIAATVDAETGAKIRAVIQAAGGNMI